MITSPHRSRERILVFGVGGTGKTHLALQIARDACEGTVWFIETDPTLDRMLEDPEFEGLKVSEEYRDGEPDDSYTDADGTVVVYHCTTWAAVRDAIAAVWGQAQRDDWIIVDNITLPWDWVQSHYWSMVHGVELDDFLLMIRKAQLDAGDDTAKATEAKFNEWSFINPHFAKHFTDKMVNPPCHLIMTAQQADYVSQYDDRQKDTAGLYSQFGVKVKGQKQAGHLSHTVLWLSKTRAGEHKVTTIKDRGGRYNFEREPWTDFPHDYLVEVAGWQQEQQTPSPAPAKKSVPAKK